MTRMTETEDRLQQDWRAWHEAREEELRTPHGWLSLTALHWLGPDATSFPDLPGPVYVPSMVDTISFADFEKVDIRAGTVVDAKPFPEARKPAFRLWVDFGAPIGVKGTVRSENRMAASKPKRRIGWRVASMAMSGVDTAGTAEAWNRVEWLEATLPAWQKLVNPLAEHIVKALGRSIPAEAATQTAHSSHLRTPGKARHSRKPIGTNSATLAAASIAEYDSAPSKALRPASNRRAGVGPSVIEAPATR